MKLDRQNRRFVSYRHDPEDAETIGDNRVIALFEDRAFKWVTTGCPP
jgi:hypothetical protein